MEFYYYKQPVVKKIEPKSGVVEGGTQIEIYGAWFDYKIEYGLVPHCMIGDKITRGTFVSTVRIVCTSPPNTNTAEALPVKVSLNGVNWVDSGFRFGYFEPPVIKGISPKSGKMQGGTEIYISGEKFSNITEVRKALCKFEQVLEGRPNPEHIVYPKTIPAYYLNETTMMCASPSGFRGGDQAFVSLTFNAKDYTKNDQAGVFSFFNIIGSFPRSGPADAYDEVILIRGAGFKPGAEVICQLNNT